MTIGSLNAGFFSLFLEVAASSPLEIERGRREREGNKFPYICVLCALKIIIRKDPKSYLFCRTLVVLGDIQLTLQSVYPCLLQMAMENRP